MKIENNKKLKFPNFGVGALLAGVYFYVAINFSYSDVFGNESRYYFLISQLLLIYFPVHFLFNNRLKVKLDYPFFFYFSLFVFSFYSCFLLGIAQSNYNTLIAFFKVFIIFFIIFYYVDNRKKFLIVLFSLFLSGFALYYFNKESVLISKMLYETFGDTSSNSRLYGTAGNANQLTILAFCALWASTTLFFYFKSKIYRFIFLSPLPFLFYLIILSGSKKGLLSILIFMAFVLLFHVKKILFRRKIFKEPLLIFSFYVLVILIMVLMFQYLTESYYGQRLYSALTLESVHGYDKARADLGFAALKMWMESPLWGKGFDNFRNLSAQYGAKPDTYSHSSLLGLLANLGVFGIFFYFGFLFLLIRKSLLFMKNIKNNKDIILLKFGTFFILIVVFFNLFAVLFFDKVLIPLLASYAGYLFSLNKKNFSITKDR
ncbi:MAG: O-antigen ligase family protein [Desulforegulaceae bacterium]|nr:O-antigen ligase family protein [Desulforegulaceae bacterium]